MVSMAMYWNSLLFCIGISPEAWVRAEVGSERGLSCPLRVGLGGLSQLLFVGIDEALATQIVVPDFGESLVLGV